MERTLAYRRDRRYRAITRKKRIARKRDGHDWYRYDGQYDKGKIHCGCGICKFGKKFHLPTIRDERETEAVNEALADYYAA